MPKSSGIRSFLQRHSRASSHNRQAKDESSPLRHGPSDSRGEQLASQRGASGKSEQTQSNDEVSDLLKDASDPPSLPVLLSPRTLSEPRPTHDSSQTPGDLWDQAYKKLQAEDPKLLDSYKRCVLRAHGTQASATTSTTDLDALDSKGRERCLATQIEQRLQAIKQDEWGAATEVYQKTVKLVLFAKDFIAQAVRNEPHAALAWAGVSMLLPLLVNPAIQNEAATKGLADVSGLILQYRVVEITFRAHSARFRASGDVNVRLLIEEIEKDIVGVYGQILAFQFRMARHYSRHPSYRYMCDLATSDDWQGMWTAINSSDESIQKRLDKVDTVHVQQALSEQTRQFQTFSDKAIPLLESIHSSMARVEQSLADGTSKAEQDRLLAKLPYVDGAAFNSLERQHEAKCLPDTRVDLILSVLKWAEIPTDQCLFWLNGMAGTGKSTIARTIAHKLQDRQQLAASFFFSRGRGDLGLAGKLFYTIAVAMAGTSAVLRRYVCQSIDEQPNLVRQAAIPEQYEKLICQPLRKMRDHAPLPRPVVIVIDALDECDNEEDIDLVLRLLAGTNDLNTMKLRIFLTSRPETSIRSNFREMNSIMHRDLVLHALNRSVVERDIRVFLMHELEQIRRKRSLPSLWPEQQKLDLLVEKSDCLFIFAATACRFIGGAPRISPDKRLSQVISHEATGHLPTRNLDEMYTKILLDSVAGEYSEDEKVEMVAQFRRVVGSIIVMFDALSVNDLESLLFESSPDSTEILATVLDPLHSVLDISDDPGDPIRLLHPSFRDFLLDKQRCLNSQFWIEKQQVHHDLSDRCLDLMEQSLIQNICHLPGSAVFVDEVSEASLSQHLPLGLRYACCHWVSHAEHERVSLSDGGPVHNFLRQYCPYWLEAMGLIGKIPETITMMIQLESLIESKKAPELTKFIQDILRFMLTFSHVLTKAPLQLYSAGLVFSPTHSVFRGLFSSQAPTDFEVRTQLPSEWNACTQTLEGHSDLVRSVVFSPNGSRVASGSWDNTVRVWDVQTGQCQHTLKGHSGGVMSVVFSPDGSRVISGSGDNTVRVWDVQTGQCQHTLEGHSDRVSSVVFSPDGSRVASGSDDKTVRVWDVASSTELLCYDTRTYKHEIEFADDSMKITVNGDLLSVPFKTLLPGTTAESPEPLPNLPISKLGIKGDWVTLSSERILWLPPEYRPGDWASKNDTIAIGSHTGRVTFVRYAATRSLSM